MVHMPPYHPEVYPPWYTLRYTTLVYLHVHLQVHHLGIHLSPKAFGSFFPVLKTVKEALGSLPEEKKLLKRLSGASGCYSVIPVSLLG